MTLSWFKPFRLGPRNLYLPNRAYYSSLSKPLHSIYISQSTDPYLNLSVEDWLFRNKNADEPLLFMYRDSPCVVIGRNQNPWKEVNLQALRAHPDVLFIRRRSGGGAVYHDLGNTNFSIHLPRQSFDRHFTSSIVLKAVQSLGIDAHLNERNDICVGEEKMSSAYKIVNKRAYHHGTMLISTRLDTLGNLLRSDKDTMVTKGVPSVRSPVCNLQKFNPDINHEAFVEAVVQQFRDVYKLHDADACSLSEDGLKGSKAIQTGVAELSSWDWAFGQTPEFTYTIKKTFEWGDVTATIVSRHGIITSCRISLANTTVKSLTAEAIEQLEQSFKDTKYGHSAETDISLHDAKQAEIRRWMIESFRD